jgi:hypothetical protein
MALRIVGVVFGGCRTAQDHPAAGVDPVAARRSRCRFMPLRASSRADCRLEKPSTGEFHPAPVGQLDAHRAWFGVEHDCRAPGLRPWNPGARGCPCAGPVSTLRMPAFAPASPAAAGRRSSGRNLPLASRAKRSLRSRSMRSSILGIGFPIEFGAAGSVVEDGAGLGRRDALGAAGRGRW